MENIPQSKYEVDIYKFGQIVEKKYHNTPLEEPYWSYKMVRAGRQYGFWYSEEEVEKLEKSCNNLELY